MPLPTDTTTPERSAAAVLQARRLCKVFGSGQTQVTALRDVDLDVWRGELLAIVGPSGSGKSTLLHLLGGIEPPTSGEVFVEGAAFGSLDDEQRSLIRRRRIGFVFQKINLLPTLSAVENVALPLLIDGTSRAEALARAEQALETVGLADRASHLPRELSGGEQQRVGIARALVVDPAAILADEPTGALDRATGQRVLAELRACVEGGRAVVVVTHDPEVAARADRCRTVRDGRLWTAPQDEPAARWERLLTPKASG